MTREQYRLQWLKWHKQYENKAYKIFNAAIKKSMGSINIDQLTYDNYKQRLALWIMIAPIEQAYLDVYINIGLQHGERVGKGINKDIKAFSSPLFSQIFQQGILGWIRDNVGDRIVSVTQTIAERIGRLVEQATLDNLTLQEMQRYVRKEINDPKFTKYQALRIARTETTAASNHAATVSGETSGILLEKVWISTKDSRTRDGSPAEWDHLHMDGIAVGQNNRFRMTSRKGKVNLMLYPGDPAGDAGNVIQCRCAVAFRPVRDSDGNVVRRN